MDIETTFSKYLGPTYAFFVTNLASHAGVDRIRSLGSPILFAEHGIAEHGPCTYRVLLFFIRWGFQEGGPNLCKRTQFNEIYSEMLKYCRKSSGPTAEVALAAMTSFAFEEKLALGPHGYGPLFPVRRLHPFS